MKLNLGCGRNPMPGFINVDIVKYPGVDVIADVLKLPYENGTVDSIYAKDLIEHFNYQDVKPLLREWSRVLKKNGTITLEFPDALKHCQMLVSGKWNIEKFNYQFFSEREPGQTPGEDWNLHKCAFTDELIIKVLADVNIFVTEITHFETPSTFNMKVVGKKV